MASTAKYQPAPQRDSLDEPHSSYTQAPPSYQTAGPSINEGGYGTPRAEDDNLPDDFKVRLIPLRTVSSCFLDLIMADWNDVDNSLEVQWPKRPSTSACHSSARSTAS